MGLLIPSAYIGALFYFGIVELAWPRDNSYSIAYFVGGITSMLLVILLTLLLTPKKKSAVAPNATSINRWLDLWTPFFVLAIVGGAVTVVDLSVTMNYSSFDLVSIRQSFSYRDPTPLAYLSNLLIPFSLMLLGVTIISLEQLGLVRRVLGIAIGLSVPLLLSVGLGGRSQIVDLLVLIPWWLLQRPVFGKPIIPGRSMGFLASVAVLAAAIWFLAVISVSRSYAGDMQFAEVLRYNVNTVSLVPEVEDYLYQSNSVLATGLSEAVFYWTSPLAAFDILYNEWQLPPDLVRSISPVIYRRLGFLDLPTLEQIVSEQRFILIWQDIPPNMFYTATFSLIGSFGRIGAIIVQLILAFVAAKTYVSARRTRKFTTMYLSSLFFLMFFLWFQNFLTAYPIHEYGFYWCALFLLLGRVLPRKATKRQLKENHS